MSIARVKGPFLHSQLSQRTRILSGIFLFSLRSLHDVKVHLESMLHEPPSGYREHIHASWKTLGRSAGPAGVLVILSTIQAEAKVMLNDFQLVIWLIPKETMNAYQIN